MEATASTGQKYAQELGELWPGVQRALSALDTIAAEPESYDEHDVAERLSRLQYQLHLGSEHVYGLEPPAGAETAHAELADALAHAREVTAEVAEATEADGLEAVRPLLHEWRGVLFRVRLARMRLVSPPVRPEVAPAPASPGSARPLIAFLLSLAGACALAAGAGVSLWPLWAAGILAVGAGLLAYRP